MKATRSIREMLAEGKELEQAGQLPEAATIYQKIVDDDRSNQEAIGRLLVIYRKLKEYSKELRVINGALAANEQLGREMQEKWIKAHPGAAGAGKAIFRKLGGAGMSDMAANPLVNKLLKRKALVEKRVGDGKNGKRAVVRRIASKVPAGRRKHLASAEAKKAERAAAVEQKRKEREESKQAAAAARQQAAEDRRRQAEARKMQQQEAKAAKQKAKVEKHPSLFVISLRYQASLDKIDAMMPRHMTFLDKHYKQGDFLVSGRQIPRTGGIIIAKGKNRASVERLMQQDPFVKGKLVSLDIVEFSASQVSKGLSI